TKLVLARDELHIIRAGKEVSIVIEPSGNAAASGSDRIHRGSGCTPDHDGAGRLACKQSNVRRKRNDRGRIEIERRTREPGPDGVEESRGKNVGFLRATDLAAEERNGPEKWVRERRSVVPVVHGICSGESVLTRNVLIESHRAEVFSN